MDTVDRVETTRFLGGEFLLWLWHSHFASGDVDTALGVVDISFESKITLTDLLAIHERLTVHGKDPTSAPEASEALRQGKVPTQVGLRVIFDQCEWLCTFDALKWALTSVKLPALSAEDEDEIFYERMQRLEQLDDILAALYAAFLELRITNKWGTTTKQLKTWVTKLGVA